MSLEYKDRVMVASSTTGTGTFTLGSAVDGHQDFDVIGDGNTCFYHAEEVDGSGVPTGAFEIGLGTFTLSGTTLTREKIVSSSNQTGTVPTIAAKGTVSSVSASTPLATNAPSGVELNSVLVLFVATTLTTGTLETPTGWTMVAQIAQANGNHAAILLRLADGTATDTPNLTSSSGSFTGDAVIYRLANANYLDLAEAIVTATDSSIDTSGDIPAFTVSVDNSLQLVLASFTAAETITATSGSLTEENDNTSDRLAILSKERDTGSISAETYTTSASVRKAVVGCCVKAAHFGKVSFADSLRISVINIAAKAGKPDIQIFTSNSIWTKPIWTQDTEIICIGGGGGGGSCGGSSQAGVVRGGGGGASGGVISVGVFKTATLNPLETVTIGAAGTGGIGGASGGTASAGGATSFGSWVYAAGGAIGGTATSGTGAAGSANGTTGLFQQASLAGAVSVDGGAGNAASNSTTLQCPGGGAGGGRSSAGGGTAQAGGAGGGFSSNSVTVNSVAGGAAGTVGAGQNGGNGNQLDWLYGIKIGTGGGGGAGTTGATGGNGGNGGDYGAGGGGSGVGETNSGTGGNGGAGICVVVSY